ncbi:MAG: hypothetical protein HRU33_20215 [Rhodobacteraceae bacterium]|nr:hypothetical protein [Paracoccaceae bacterium]
MLKNILIIALATLAGCETYTDKTSPCLGRNGKPVVSRNSISPAMSFAPAVSRNATDLNCVYQPFGRAE